MTAPINPECTICIAPLSEATTVLVLPCSHSFCNTCIRRWRRQRNGRTCPLCRTEISSVLNSSRREEGEGEDEDEEEIAGEPEAESDSDSDEYSGDEYDDEHDDEHSGEHDENGNLEDLIVFHNWGHSPRHGPDSGNGRLGLDNNSAEGRLSYHSFTLSTRPTLHSLPHIAEMRQYLQSNAFSARRPVES